MFQSQFFLKTIKQAPKEEQSLNAKYLEQAGFIQKVLAGVYTFMPLGFRVLQKIEQIVREEISNFGSEMLMPSLQPRENWEQTGRWQGMDVLFKLQSRHGFDYSLGPTHEEIVAPAAKKIIASYRDLPLAVFQIQTKFRDEPRAKSGLMRGREFRMKDLYSFHSSQQDLDDYYSRVQQGYARIFKRLGLKALLTEASGGSFSKYSHEYQVEVASGEDTIYVCEKCGLAKNKEIFSGKSEKCTVCGKSLWRETRGAEVGNVFKLGTKFSVPFELNYIDRDNKLHPVIMGCYGIGTSRLLGVIAELFNDSTGLIWPDAVAPFKAHLIALACKNPRMQKKIQQTTQRLYQGLQKSGVEVLLDDRDELSAGARFADSDLIGIPNRLVISEKTLEKNSLELKKRSAKHGGLVKISEVISKLK